MVDATRALLDELMGEDRNLGAADRQKPKCATFVFFPICRIELRSYVVSLLCPPRLHCSLNAVISDD